jgi:B12-binding domain/radical SAM domain protein
LRFVPQDLDYVDVPDYRYAMRSAFKYIGLRNLIPYLEWPSYPTTMLLNTRGCTQDCAICGGSRSAYRRVCGRAAPAYRSPEKLIEDVRAIRSFSRAPIFVVHDPRMGGMQRCRTFFRLLRAERAPNPFCFELFFPAGDDFFDQLAGSVSSWSLEMSIESPDERLRRENGKFACSNAHIEATIDSALRHGCQKLDLFFMAGLPHQTYADVLATVDYCEGLARRFGDDRRLGFFISPLGPFLDPGSRAFEEPELGYRRLFPSLEAHRQAVLQPTWAQMLSFETDAMDRSTLVAATYDAAEGLNALKLRHGMIDEATYQNVKARSEIARSVLDEALRAEKLPKGEREEVYARLNDRVSLANAGTLCGVDELKWGSAGRFQLSPTLVRYLLQGFFMEIPHAVRRLFGQYDSAIYQPRQTSTGSLTAEAERLEAEPPPAAS